jgi:hypothetical protein
MWLRLGFSRMSVGRRGCVCIKVRSFDTSEAGTPACLGGWGEAIVDKPSFRCPLTKWM